MQRILLAAAITGVLGTSAWAQARTDLYTLTCASAAATVNARGAVIGNTGPNTYERIVSNAGFCQRNEQAIPYFSKSRDQAQCMVGYECRDITLWDSK